MIVPILLVCVTFAHLPDTAKTGDTTVLLKKPEGLGTSGGYHIMGGYGQFPKANTDFYLNHRSKSLDLVATSSYSFDKSYSLLTSRDNSCQFPIDPGTGIRTFYQESTPTNNHVYGRLGLDYQADKNTVVGVSASIGATFNRLQGSTNSVFNSHGDSLLSQIIQKDGREDLVSVVTEVNLDKVLSKNKKLGIDLAYIRRSDHYFPMDRSTFLNVDGVDVSNTLANVYTQQNTLTRTGIDIFSAKAEYTQTLDSALYLKTGLSCSDSKMASTVNAEGLRDGAWINNYGLSGRVTLHEPLGKLYSSLHFDNGKFGVDVELAYEYVRRELHDSDSLRNFPDRYGQFLPSLTVWKKLSSAARLMIGYNREFTLPGYGYIASNVDFDCIYGVSVGNPFLQPVVSNDIVARLQYKDLWFSLDGRRQEKTIVGVQQSESPAGNMFYIMAQNMVYSESVSAEVNLPFQLTSWLQWSSDLVGSWNQFRADPQPFESFVTSVFQRNYFGYNLKSSLNLKLPYQFHIDVSGSYNSGGWGGGYNFTGAGAVSLLISKSFADHSTLQLSVSDLFRSMYTHLYLNAPELAYHLHSNAYAIPESRQTELVNITWQKSFGSNKIQNPRNWELTSGDLEYR